MSLKEQKTNKLVHYENTEHIRKFKVTKQQTEGDISPHQRGSEPPVQPGDSLGPQQLPGDLRGRHSHHLWSGAGVVGAAEDCVGSRHLQGGDHARHHPLLGCCSEQGACCSVSRALKATQLCFKSVNLFC